MAKIVLTEPNGPYKCEIDTDVMNVTISKNFLGIRCIAESGDILSIAQRDSGFEIIYHDRLIEFKE